MIPLHVPQLSFKDMLSSPKEDYANLLKNQFCRNFKKNEVVFTEDGRNALYMALKAMDLNKDNEILIPAYICSSVNEVVRLFCRPIYADIDRRTFNISPFEIEKNITKNTKAILVAHLYGNSCDMNRIMDIAKDNNLLIIEDVAQALNGKYGNELLGSFGDFTILSFRFTKDITSFHGGALLSNEKIKHTFQSNSAIKSSLMLGATLAAMKQIWSLPAGLYAPIKNYVLFPFFESSASKFRAKINTLSNYQCYILYKQFSILNNLINIRRKNADYYAKKLKGVISLPKEQEGGYHTYFRYTIQTANRDRLYNYLMENSIEADKMYDYYLSPLPNSIIASSNNLNIPVHQGLNDNHLKKIVEVIREAEGMG